MVQEPGSEQANENQTGFVPFAVVWHGGYRGWCTVRGLGISAQHADPGVSRKDPGPPSLAFCRFGDAALFFRGSCWGLYPVGWSGRTAWGDGFRPGFLRFRIRGRLRRGERRPCHWASVLAPRPNRMAGSVAWMDASLARRIGLGWHRD